MVFMVFQAIALNSCSSTMKTGINSVISGGETVPVENKPNQIQTRQEKEEEEEEEEEEEYEGNAMEPVAGRLEIRVLDRAEGSAVVETVNNNLPPTSQVPTKRPELNEVEEHCVKGKKHFEHTVKPLFNVPAFIEARFREKPAFSGKILRTHTLIVI
jgi:hypothetical protein